MPPIHLGIIKIEVLRRGMSRIAAPSVGEQYSADVGKQRLNLGHPIRLVKLLNGELNGSDRVLPRQCESALVAARRG